MPVAVNELILADPNAIAPGLRDLFLFQILQAKVPTLQKELEL